MSAYRNPNAIDVAQVYDCTSKRLSISNFIKLSRLIKDYNISQLRQSPGPLSKQPLRIKLGFALIHSIFKVYGVSVRYYGNCCSAVAASKVQLDHSKVDKYYLRSHLSIEYAKSFYGDRCTYIPDLSFLLHFQVKKAVRGKSNMIAFNIREGNNVEKLIKKSVELITHLTNQGYKVVLYYQVASDCTIMKKLYMYCEMLNVSMREEIVWYDAELKYCA